MTFCERCRSNPIVMDACGVGLCLGCFDDLGLAVSRVGQAEEASFLCDVPGPVMFGKKLGQSARSATDAGAGASGAIEKTASAAGEIAKTVKVVAVIVAVGGVAWVGYALWKASRQANALQAEAKTALLAHPELLRI